MEWNGLSDADIKYLDFIDQLILEDFDFQKLLTFFLELESKKINCCYKYPILIEIFRFSTKHLNRIEVIKL